jgi:hypothetical protein
MSTTETFGIISTTGLEDPFVEDSGAIIQSIVSVFQSAATSIVLQRNIDETRTPHLHSVPTVQITTAQSDVPRYSNKQNSHIATPSTVNQALFRPPSISQLLFRVTHDESMGCSPSGRATLPGENNPYLRPLHDQRFDWRAWLQSHGDFEKRNSVGTSFTSNFLHALSIALCYRVEGKRGITIIVVQRQFLIPGTCLRFDDLITWTMLSDEVFGAKKKNEYMVIGPIPPAAVISRFTLENLKTLKYLQLFPNLRSESMPTKELEELRQAMQSRSPLRRSRFNIDEHQSKFFLASLLGNQDGICPHDRSTKLLVTHFLALAEGHVFRGGNFGAEEFARVEEFERKLDKETLSHIDVVLEDIRMLQGLNKERNINPNERFDYKEKDFEGAIKRWATNNPVHDIPETRSSSIRPTSPIPFALAPSQPSQSGSNLLAEEVFPAVPAPITALPSTQTPPPTPSPRRLEPSPIECFTPTSSYPSPGLMESSCRSRLVNQMTPSPETPSKKRKITHD